MLSEKDIRALKPEEKRYEICDSACLYLRVSPTGRKTWIFRKQGPKGGRTTLGAWPQMTAFAARTARDEAAGKVRTGTKTTFRELAERFLDAHLRRTASPDHVEKIEHRLARYIYPEIGDMDTADLTSPRVYELTVPVQQDGHIELAHRIIGLIGQILAAGRRHTRSARFVVSYRHAQPRPPRNACRGWKTDAPDRRAVVEDDQSWAFAAGVHARPSRRTSSRPLGRDRSGQRDMANSGREDEDAPPAHRSVVAAGDRDP